MQRLAASLVPFVVLSFRALSAEDDYRQEEWAKRPTPSWVKLIDQGTRDPKLAGYETPDGIRLEIAAKEPTVVNPVGLSFDDDGRPHVIRWRKSKSKALVDREVELRDGTKFTTRRMVKDELDVLQRLEDRDRDGVWDHATTIYDDLEMPSTVYFHEPWAYFASVGRVYRRRLTPGAEKPYAEEELVRGLCAFNQHQASGIAESPDGWLYISSGDDDNRAEGTDGSGFRVLRTGVVFRMLPDGSRVTEFAQGFRNPYRDVVVDPFGNVFHADNDQEDGSKFQGCRLIHVVDGGDYGWRLWPGAVCCRPDLERGAVSGELPGKLPVMLKTGRGAPAGLAMYSGTKFPTFFRGLLIYPDVFRKLVRAYRLERDGATFRIAEELVLMRSKDEHFRPCQAVVGPDGALYIVDWRTPSAGPGWLWGDSVHGRIWKLSWGGNEAAPAIGLGRRDAWKKLRASSDEALVEGLRDEDLEIRRRALREIERRLAVAGARTSDPKSKQRVAWLRQSVVDTANDRALVAEVRATSIGGMFRLKRAGLLQHIPNAKNETNAEIRRLIFESQGRLAALSEKLPALPASSFDQRMDPAVERAFVLASARIEDWEDPPEEEIEALARKILARVSSKDLGDVYLHDGYVRALEILGVPAMLLAHSILRDDPERLLSVIEAWRSRDPGEVLDRFLTGFDFHTELDDAQRRRVLATYGRLTTEPPIDTKTLAGWIKTPNRITTETQLVALESLAHLGAHAESVVLPVALKLLEDKDARVLRNVVRVLGDRHLVRAAIPLAKLLKDTELDRAERFTIIEALGKLRQKGLPFGKQTERGVELVVDELLAILQAEKDSAVVAELLGMLASVDLEKTLPHAREKLASSDPAVVRAAITALGAQRDEALRLANAYVDGQIDHEYRPQIVSVLERHRPKNAAADDAIVVAIGRVLEGGLMSSLDAESLARVEALVKTKGEATRGRELFLDSKRTQCSTCHKLEGVGSHIGPDLTRIWDTLTISEIVESILEPSKRIKENFETYTITTKAGQVYSGLKMLDDPDEVVIRDTLGKDHTISKADIAIQATAETSLMPDGLLNDVKLDEFVDLLAFLKSREAQEALRGGAAQVWVVGPFSRVVQKPEPPEKSADPLKITVDSRGRILQWSRLDALSDGTFDLGRKITKPKSSAYAFTWLYSPKAQEIELAIDFEARCRLIVGGESVYTSPRGETSKIVEVKVAEGWTPVLARVARGTERFRFRIRSRTGQGIRFSPDKDE